MTTGLSPETLLAERQWIEDLARRLVRDENAADDVAQEAICRALTRPPQRVSSVRGWLHAVVTSCVRDRRRSETRRAARERAASRPESAAAPDLVARADAQRRVIEAVLALDTASRSVVLLRFFEGLDLAEIARRAGEPPGTVRSRLHRALAVLRRRLDGEYGGDRAAWSAALLQRPLVAKSPQGLGAGKGVALVTTQTKVGLGAAALLVILCACLFDADAIRPAPAQPSAPGETAAPVPLRRERIAAGETVAEPAAAGEPVAVVVESPATRAPRRLTVRLLAPREPEAAPADAAKDDGVTVDLPRIDPGASGFSLQAGSWTKWKPVPEKGTVTLSGRVVDALGAPLAGAQVFRVEPAAGGGEGDVRDFEHIHEIARTDAAGAFEAGAQPARPYRLAADHHGSMMRPGGLLFHALAAVDPQENETIANLRLEVPVDGRAFGSVSGRVTGPDGEPVACWFGVGAQTANSGADGRFHLDAVPAGEIEVAVDDPGFARLERTITVRPGMATEANVRLELRRAGDREIAGVVRDESGNPVGGVRLWCGGVDGVSRRSRSAADGTFRFDRLPAADEGESYTVTTLEDPQTSAVFLASLTNLEAPAHGLVLAVERAVGLRIVVKDALSGAALPIFNVTLERDEVVDGERRKTQFAVATLAEEDGSWTVRVPRSDVTLFVEAPDHRPFHGAVTIPKEDAEFEVLVEMRK